VAVQLAMRFALDRYDLRHGNNTQLRVLRNWNLEGSNDGVEWVVLRRHVNDTSLAERAHSTASWEVNNPDSLAFFRFRIITTGLNSWGDHCLLIMGLELYGRVDEGGGGGGRGFAPETVRFPTLLAALSLETRMHLRDAPHGTPPRAAC
jgi:hypothetical protein